MNANQTTEKSAVSPLAEAASDTQMFCVDLACRGSELRVRHATVLDGQILPACSRHATARDDGSALLFDDAQAFFRKQAARRESAQALKDLKTQSGDWRQGEPFGRLALDDGSVVAVDLVHYRAALAWKRSDPSVGFCCFAGDGRWKRSDGGRRERDADRAPSKGVAPSGYGTSKPKPKGKPAARGESTHSDAAHDLNTVTAIAVAEGKPRSEIAVRLGVEPAEEERQIRRLHHLGGVFAAIGRRVWADAWENLFSQIARVEAGEPEPVPAAPEVVADFVAGFVRKPAKKRARREGARATA